MKSALVTAELTCCDQIQWASAVIDRVSFTEARIIESLRVSIVFRFRKCIPPFEVLLVLIFLCKLF